MNISKGCCFAHFHSAEDLAQLYNSLPLVIEGQEITIKPINRARGEAARLNAEGEEERPGNHPRP
ncbi:uncharacterized protein ACA1_295490 [Acanthamoeba castellanii str. Neff]|uniref:RRM domain-containing protein n=1 Tax=Acanthamoeba castellanii (strain ATCC 30010 / Neff) TaxID=1257118 RepID=L8HLB2_ACACF|nr:uncharacterized protein ACA1_295490 [Acanthamoeba castellanii str. Neff]ELR25463.1 hypothetical protein ACA1_295490 [Acanthamoeba castellanii str. Neff]